MGFAERAVAACERTFEAGMASEVQARDVLRSSGDGAWAVRWLCSSSRSVRRMAARILAEKGPAGPLVAAAAEEKERDMLLFMLGVLGRPGADVAPLAGMLASEDMVVRDAAVEMFRAAGKTEYLFPMVFSDDDALVRRTKRMLDEKGQG